VNAQAKSTNASQDVALDYVDLKGGLHTVTLKVSSEQEAVSALRDAWNSSLIWYFKLHLKASEPLSMTRSIPWSETLLRDVITLANLVKYAERARAGFSIHEKEVLDLLSHSPNSQPPSDLRHFSWSFSEWKAMEYLAENHALKLEVAGVNLSAVSSADKVNAVSAVAKALQSLKRIEKSEYDDMFTVGRMTRVSASEFLSGLPRVSGVFSNKQEVGIFAALEREA